MTDIPLGLLFGALFVLILLSAFFSGSETALMTLNRYRLQHLVKMNHPGAIRANQLLQRPDRLIGLILLGNNFINILASSIATVIALRVWGEAGIAAAAGLLTLVILIFAEVAPKTLAAIHPERLAFPAAYIYKPLMFVMYPIVYLVNQVANRWLAILGIDVTEIAAHDLGHEELRTVVAEAGSLIPKRHRKMLLGILDLESASVEDIMIPTSEIHGINLDDDWDEIVQQLISSPYSRLPVFQTNLDHVQGFVQIKRVAGRLGLESFDREAFLKEIEEAYFIPNSTTLYRQLINFQREKFRTGLVVDEYGDILGLLTLDDVLEEIVGEFTTDPSDTSPDIQKQKDGDILIDASVTVRELNRVLHWELSTQGPKTLNGLILEYLESIPEPGTSLKLGNYPLEIIQVHENAVKLVKFRKSRLP